MRHENPTARRDPELRWQLLDDLATARDAWGLKDRTLAVLRALLSFLPKGERVNLTVFPSNRTLSARLMGMPESTLRRHLAKLAEVGLIARRPSPNGKRYRIGQTDDLCFGLDLSPIFAVAQTIREKARAAIEEMTARRVLRQKIRLAIQHLPDPQVAPVLKALRRKMDSDGLQQMLAGLTVDMPPETNVSAAQNDCHIEHNPDPEKGTDDNAVAITALSEVEDLAQSPMSHPGDLKRVGEQAAHLLAVHSAWTYARQARGVAWATMALAYVIPRVDRLRKPDSYLQTLARRAGAGSFDLIEALRQDQTRRSAWTHQEFG